MTEREKYIKLIDKLKKISKKNEKYDDKRQWDKKDIEKYDKIGEELIEHKYKLNTDFSKIYRKDLKPNNKMTRERFIEIKDMIADDKIFSLDEIPELKKAESESDKENKKPLTVTQQNNLIRKIPDDMFTREEILKIVEHIRNGTMTKASQMPNPTKKEPKVPLDAVVLDKKKVKKLKADVEPEAKAKPSGKALKAVVKQGRPKKIKTPEQIKAEEQAKADKLKKKEAKLKPYFKIGEIPKGYRRASMQEAKEAGKINYWGVKKVDNKILNLTEETDPKALKAKITEKTIKLGGLMAKFQRIKKDIVTAKNKNDNKAEVKLNAELEETKKLILQANAELSLLKEKVKKPTGEGLHDTNTDDDADSDDDNAHE